MLFIFVVIGFNSFSKLYIFQFFPISIIISFYFHGLFEGPAFILASIISFSSSDWILTEIEREKNLLSIGKGFIINYFVLFTVLVILLLIGAFVETQITPIIVKQIFEQIISNSTS